MEWIAANWWWIGPAIPVAIIIADKVVTTTPNKYDDIIITGLKAAWKRINKKKNPENLEQGL